MHVLFICNQNRHRSPTAERLFRHRFETRSAGLFGGHIVSSELLDWADLIVVMDDVQRSVLGERFPRQYLAKRIVSFDVPDVFSFGDSALVALLERRMSELLPLL